MDGRDRILSRSRLKPTGEPLEMRFSGVTYNAGSHRDPLSSAPGEITGGMTMLLGVGGESPASQNKTAEQVAS